MAQKSFICACMRLVLLRQARMSTCSHDSTNKQQQQQQQQQLQQQ
jgi:hypothetical protein